MTKNYWDWKPVFHMDPYKSALLVIDMQNAFLEKGSPLEVPMAREQVPVFKKMLSYCREQGIPVIYTEFCIGPDFHYKFYWKNAEQRGLRVEAPYCELWDGKYETEIYHELKPLPSEKVIKKFGYDCFAETDLDSVLKSLGVSNLIVTGTVLNWCVDSTVRAAYHKHYDVTVISDAVSSYDHAGGTAEDWCKMELNLIAEAFGRVVSSDDAIEEMNSFQQQEARSI
ncbi:cysteine hydrolase [Siminovitchia acidinfaciens]|uniref:Cysteine hydrolase n=1 Tax=Siminovitchia acidinfaciens TaxID=2321395 RepID=A0A429Y7C5_9BACI|nr:isochorismatase family cysteine hydrolase [Siminovitchia acidinfaciens]RST77359.1 cysteine hydrolase [Siminovitchia acidinfaciens]